MWKLWRQGFTAWEQTTAQYLEKVLANPAVLNRAAGALSTIFKAKAMTDRALAAWWSAWGLATREEQLRALHKLNQLESRLLDLEEGEKR